MNIRRLLCVAALAALLGGCVRYMHNPNQGLSGDPANPNGHLVLDDKAVPPPKPTRDPADAAEIERLRQQMAKTAQQAEEAKKAAADAAAKIEQLRAQNERLKITGERTIANNLFAEDRSVERCQHDERRAWILARLGDAGFEPNPKVETYVDRDNVLYESVTGKFRNKWIFEFRRRFDGLWVGYSWYLQPDSPESADAISMLKMDINSKTDPRPLNSDQREVLARAHRWKWEVGTAYCNQEQAEKNKDVVAWKTKHDTTPPSLLLTAAILEKAIKEFKEEADKLVCRVDPAQAPPPLPAK